MGVTAAIIGAIVGLGGIGTSIYEGVQSSNQNAANQAANQAQLAQEQQAQANQANLTKQEAVLGASGQTQAQTGGSLTGPGTSSFTDLLAGYPGYQGGSTGSASGVSATGGASGASSNPEAAVATILAALRNSQGGGNSFGAGDISGGNWPAPNSQPQAFQQLSTPVLG